MPIRARGAAGTFPLVALLLSTLTVVAAHAQDSQQRVEVHGFGDWVYGRTNGNLYLAGEEKGNYEDASLGLNVMAIASDRLRIVGQAEWVDGPQGTEVHLDYSFAEWRISDKLKIRAGKVKQPFGISAEVFDIGTLRPFVELPQAVYGPVGLVGESYKGVGLGGSFDLKGGWNLSYDVYGGGQEVRELLAPEAVAKGEEFANEVELEKTRNMIGGRVVAETPVAGLRIGASAYTGNEIGSNRRNALGLQAEYLAGPWLVRSEYVRETVADDLKASGFYLEAAYRIDSRWQVAGQFGRLTSDVLSVPTPVAPSLLDHKELAASLNFWWSANFVFKLSFHHVVGNRFAGPAPEDLAQVVAAGTLKEKTNAVFLAAQFSF
jgi:Phosphate-selective porin O and P